MGRPDVCEEMQQFPGPPLFAMRSFDFVRDSEVSAEWAWDFSGTGEDPPDGVDDVAFGTVTLGGVSTEDNAYTSGHPIGEAIRLNGLGKTYEFLFGFTLSDATQMDAAVGIFKTNTDPINTVVTDGIWLRKDDGDTNWDLVLAFDAVTFPDDYTQVNAIAVADTLKHWFGIRIITDANTLGKGTITAFMDGAQIGAPLAVTNLPHDEEMTMYAAKQNGEAAAKTLILDYAGSKAER